MRNQGGQGTIRGRRNQAMTYQHILVEQEDGVGIVTLNRPDVLNAMNRALVRE